MKRPYILFKLAYWYVERLSKQGKVALTTHGPMVIRYRVAQRGERFINAGSMGSCRCRCEHVVPLVQGGTNTLGNFL